MKHIRALALLAKQNNETLVMTVNRWMIGNKHGDPIPDILLIYKGIVRGIFGFWGTVVNLIWFLSLFYWADSVGITSIFTFIIFSGVGLTFIGWSIQKIKNEVSDQKNVDEFRRAISLIQEIHKWKGGTGLILEHDWLNDGMSRFVKEYLKSQATRLKELENISWRKNEADFFRVKFNNEFEVLTLIYLLSSDRREYFG